MSHPVPHHSEADGLERPSEDSVTVPARWHYFAGLGQGSPGGCACLNECLMCSAVQPIARILGSRNQGVGMGVAPLTITLKDPLANFFLPVPMTLCPADQRS